MLDTIAFVLLMDAPIALTEEECKKLAKKILKEIEINGMHHEGDWK